MGRRALGGGAAPFIGFLFASTILSLMFLMLVNWLWLIPVGVPLRADSTYYFVFAVIVLSSVILFSNIASLARPAAIGVMASAATSIYVSGYIPLNYLVLVFLGNWIAVTLGTAIADGVVRGYSLKGVRV